MLCEWRRPLLGQTAKQQGDCGPNAMPFDAMAVQSGSEQGHIAMVVEARVCRWLIARAAGTQLESVLGNTTLRTAGAIVGSERNAMADSQQLSSKIKW